MTRARREVCRPVQAGRQSETGKRLIFLVGLFDAARQPEVHRLARLGGHVYRRTSDVLHGRVNSLDLSNVVIDEWRAIVENLDQLLAEGVGHRPPAQSVGTRP